MKKIFLWWIAAIGIALLPAFLFADRIVLKNGKTIVGTVQGQENNLITIITNKGDKQLIKKDEIVSMIYVDTKAVKKKRPVRRIPPKTNVTKDTREDNELSPHNHF
jgi:hypothetical protein